MKEIILLITILLHFQSEAKVIINTIGKKPYYDEFDRPVVNVKILNDTPSSIKFPLYFSIKSCDVNFDPNIRIKSEEDSGECLNYYEKKFVINKEIYPNENLVFKTDRCCVTYITCEVIGKIKESSFNHKFNINFFGKDTGCFNVAEYHLR